MNLLDHSDEPNRQERAQRLIHQGYDDWKHAKKIPAIESFLKASVSAPEVVFTTSLFPLFRDRVLRKVFKWFQL